MQTLPAPALPSWLESMLPFRRYRVRVGEYAMHVMESGEGFPVLMLHGNPTWGVLYRKVALALAASPLRLLMPDLLGLGLSDRVPAKAHSIDFHAQHVARLADVLGLERLVLVMQDWGGPIGGVAFADRPERVRGMVVLNTVLSPPKPDFRPTSFHRFARLPLVSDVAFRLGGFPMRTLHLVQGDQSSIRGDVARAYRWPLRKLRDRAAPLMLARMVPDSMEHPSIPALRRCEEFVRTFRGPAAIVWGDEDPVLGRVRSWIRQLLPQATVRRTSAGHFLQEEVPDVIAEAVREVAQKCGASLEDLLRRHVPADDKERNDLESMRRFARSLAEPFSRAQEQAHFTGSAVVVDPPGERVCLVHHGKLNRWLQPGGHADAADGGSMHATALREAREETGLRVRLHERAPQPLDVDVHPIPERKAEPAHLHLDVRYLVVAENPDELAHDPAESHGARWLSWDEALSAAAEPALRRLLSKARRYARGLADVERRLAP